MGSRKIQLRTGLYENTTLKKIARNYRQSGSNHCVHIGRLLTFWQLFVPNRVIFRVRDALLPMRPKSGKFLIKLLKWPKVSTFWDICQIWRLYLVTLIESLCHIERLCLFWSLGKRLRLVRLGYFLIWQTYFIFVQSMTVHRIVWLKFGHFP